MTETGWVLPKGHAVGVPTIGQERRRFCPTPGGFLSLCQWNQDSGREDGVQGAMEVAGGGAGETKASGGLQSISVPSPAHPTPD